MSEAKHTELPWSLCHHLQSPEKDASCGCGYRGGIWGGEGSSEILVCEMRNCDLHEGHDMVPVGDRATQLANAALIVTAVNDRPALLARIASLEADNARLREALGPFADIDGEGDEDFTDDTPCVLQFGRTTCFTLDLGDLRRASAALQEQAR